MSARRFALPFLLTLAAAALLAADTARAERADAFVRLGKAASVSVAESGDVATVGFLVQPGLKKKIAITVKPAAKSKLVPDVRLVAPNGSVVDPTLGGGKLKASAKLVTVTLPNVPDGMSGLWRVEVRGKDGSVGGCSVKVKGSDVAKLAATTQTVPAGGSITLPLDVGSNQAITVVVKRGKGSAILPKLRILDPTGLALDEGAFLGTTSRTGVLSLKKYRLPVFGHYRLVVSGDQGSGGGVVVTAVTAPAKTPKGSPVADPGLPADAEPGIASTLNGTASQGTGTLSFLWSQVAGPTVALSGANTSTPTFTAPATTSSLGFELAVKSNGIWSPAMPVTIEVGARPLADAGRSKAVAPGAAVTLSGLKSIDRRGSGLSYAWRQDPQDGVQVVLGTPTTDAPTFTAPAAPTVLHFGLTVDDGSLRSFEDFITVRVGDAALPTPDAGREQYVQRMATVQLSALATTTASGLVDAPIQWTQVAGPAVTLDGATSAQPAFTAPKQSTDLVFQVTAGGATDHVSVHVRAGETDRSPLTVASGSKFAPAGDVMIDASASTDPDNDDLRFRWAQIDGPALPLSSSEIESPSMALPAGNEMRTWVVMANDGFCYGPPDTVSVRNISYSGKPIAAAGADQTLPAGQPVNLDGRGSGRTQGTGPITYRWRQVSARDWFDVDQQVAAFDPAAANPSFTLPTDLSSLSTRRLMTFELVVNDGTADSAPDFVTITFGGLPANAKPQTTADASAKNPVPGTVVQLIGTVSDRDGDPTTVKWTQTSGSTVTLAGGNRILNPTFVAPASGTFTFQLVGNDGFEDGPPAQVVVVVDAAPIARIVGTPNSGPQGTNVTIDASSSSDPEGKSLAFKWTIPASVTGGPTDTSTPAWNFSAPAATVTIQVVVNDGRQDSAPASFQFTVGSPVAVAPSASVGNAPYGASVTLNANATGAGTITYQWSQLTTGPNAGDPVVALSGTSNSSLSFTVPSPTTTSGFAAPLGTFPSATFQVTGSNGTNQDTKTVKVTFYASFNNQNGAISTSKYVHQIITQSCSGASCHSTATKGCSPSYGYLMFPASTFATNSINVAACVGTKLRVDTTNGPGSSELILRLKGTGAGQTMPQGAGTLPSSDIGLIADWISQGASSSN